MRPLSAPLTPGPHIMFDETRSVKLSRYQIIRLTFTVIRSLPPGPDSPRVLEVVEKSESVSWKLEYEAALSCAAPALPSPSVKRKISPHSPLMLRKCKSGSVVPSGLMTRSLDLSLARSNSYTAGSSGTASTSEHQSLSRTVSSHAVQRAGSVRRRILPSFETLSESTESESDESKKNSPVDTESQLSDLRGDVVTPSPVDITGSDDEICEISSSSEIEIGIEQDSDNLADKRFQDENSHSDSPGSDTDPDLTIRSNLKKTSESLVGKPVSDLESPDTEVELTLKTGE